MSTFDSPNIDYTIRPLVLYNVNYTPRLGLCTISKTCTVCANKIVPHFFNVLLKFCKTFCLDLFFLRRIPLSQSTSCESILLFGDYSKTLIHLFCSIRLFSGNQTSSWGMLIQVSPPEQNQFILNVSKIVAGHKHLST